MPPLSSPGAARSIRRLSATLLILNALLMLASILAWLIPALSEPPTWAWGLVLILGLALNLALVVWLYRLHKDLQTLFAGYPISPWRAMAMYLIPLYNYWGNWRLWRTADEYLPSPIQGEGRPAPAVGRILPWFYIGWFVSRVLARASLRLPESLTLDVLSLIFDTLLYGGLYLLCLSVDRGLHQAVEAKQSA